MQKIDRLGSNTVIIFTAKVINLGLGLLFTFIISRALGDALFGVFSFGIAFVVSFSVVFDFGLHPILSRELVQDKSNAGLLFANAIYLKLLLIAVALLLLTAAAFLSDISDKERIIVLILFSAAIFSAKMSGLRRLIEMPFQAEVKMLWPSIFQILDSALLVLLCVAVIRMDKNLILIATVYAAANVPGFFLQYRASVSLVKPGWQFKKTILRRLLKESYPLAIYTGGIALYMNVDILLIKHFLTNNDVGQYSAAARLITPLTFLPFAMVSSLSPIMAQFAVENTGKLKKVFDASLKSMLFIGTCITLLFFIWADELILTFYGRQYSHAIPAFKILCCSIALLFLNYFLIEYNTARGRQRINQTIILPVLALNLVLNFVLIPVLAIEGAAAVRVLCFAIAVGLLFLLNAAEFDRKSWQKISVLFLLGVLYISVSAYYPSRSVILTAIMLPGYVLAVFVFKIFSVEEIQFVKQQLRYRRHGS
jgi:O-antigen/teichoic acid export membrane protein